MVSCLFGSYKVRYLYYLYIYNVIITFYLLCLIITAVIAGHFTDRVGLDHTLLYNLQRPNKQAFGTTGKTSFKQPETSDRSGHRDIDTDIQKYNS